MLNKVGNTEYTTEKNGDDHLGSANVGMVKWMPQKQGCAITQAVVAGFPQWQPRFDPRSDHTGFTVEKLAMG
jgi:hypothetical protein